MEFRNDCQLSAQRKRCWMFMVFSAHQTQVCFCTITVFSLNWTEFLLTWCLYYCMLFLLISIDFAVVQNVYRAIMFLCTGWRWAIPLWHVKHSSHMTDTQNFSLPSEKPEISSNYKIDGCKLEATSIWFYIRRHMRECEFKHIERCENNYKSEYVICTKDINSPN